MADVTASHGEDLAGLRPAAVLVQSREEQGIHRQGRRMAAVGRFQVRSDARRRSLGKVEVSRAYL